MIAQPLSSLNNYRVTELVGYPLVAAAIKLNQIEGLKTVDSSVWEDRDDGFYAYLALNEIDIKSMWVTTINRLCNEDFNKSPVVGRFVKRNLPSFDEDNPIGGIYLELKITNDITTQEVEKTFLYLVSRIKLKID